VPLKQCCEIFVVEEVTSSVRWGLTCDMFPILKKASAVLDKANISKGLNVFGEFVASELRGLRNDSVRKKGREKYSMHLTGFWNRG
jgi:hypothetical protein